MTVLWNWWTNSHTSVAMSHLLKVTLICAKQRHGLLLIDYRSYPSDEIKFDFFQAVVVSIQLYGCTPWMLRMHREEKLDESCARMLWAALNKSWKQHPMKQQLYGRLPPISKTIQVRWKRHAGHCWRSKNKIISDVLLWTLSHGCTNDGWQRRTHLPQLCTDTRCRLEDKPGAMDDRDDWQERARKIHASSGTWWWCKHGESINSLIPTYRLNSTITVLLKRCLWH